MGHPDESLGLGTKEETIIEEPRLYKVLLHNDDYTTVDFVIMILVNVFHKPHSEAARITLDVHRKGIGVAGIYPYDIAETKVIQVHELARQHQFPLKCSLQEA